jgi:cyclic pyranopterin phosphate synthase
MEALTGVAAAALTVYDMAKSADKSIEIGPIRLERKTGGKSGDYRRTKNS